MPARRSALVAALAAALLAVPACNRDKDDGPVKLSRSNRKEFFQSQNNLKQIGIAVHSYHDSNGQIPCGFFGPDGKPGLSWRVAILPYIEEGALYREFKLDEPWDSAHNKKLIERMPKTYFPTAPDRPGTTYYRSFTGPDAVLGVPQTGRPGEPIRGRRIFEITDGTSNTIWAAEAAEAVIWTKPDELVFDPKGPPPKLGGIFREGANVLLCDGSVHFLLNETSPDTLRALITTNGGEAVALP